MSQEENVIFESRDFKVAKKGEKLYFSGALMTYRAIVDAVVYFQGEALETVTLEGEGGTAERALDRLAKEEERLFDTLHKIQSFIDDCKRKGFSVEDVRAIFRTVYREGEKLPGEPEEKKKAPELHIGKPRVTVKYPVGDKEVVVKVTIPLTYDDGREEFNVELYKCKRGAVEEAEELLKQCMEALEKKVEEKRAIFNRLVEFARNHNAKLVFYREDDC